MSIQLKFENVAKSKTKNMMLNFFICSEIPQCWKHTEPSTFSSIPVFQLSGQNLRTIGQFFHIKNKIKYLKQFQASRSFQH